MTDETIEASGAWQATADMSHNPFLAARASLDEAKRLRATGRLEQAEQLCQTILRRFPDYFGARHTLGVVLADQRKYVEALPHLVQAVMLNPRSRTALTDLGGICLELGGYVMAAQALEQALRLQPNDPSILAMLGEIHWHNQDFEAGAARFRRARYLDPSIDAAGVGLATCLAHLGEFAEAARVLEDMVRRHPQSIEVLHLLSQFPPSVVKIDLLSAIGGAKPGAGDDHAIFEARRAITRAGALDAAGRYGEAWQALLDGNRPLERMHRDKENFDRRDRAAVLRLAERSAAPTPPSGGPHDDWPVSLFILGPSRSGKTTLERLAGVMAGVKHGYESPIVVNSVHAAFHAAGLPAMDRIVDLAPALDDLCRDFYHDELKERAKAARVFTNTRPGHIAGILRIAAIVPNARFIFIRRDRRDLALRIFMKMYDSGNFYAYDLGTIGDYLKWYDQMIDVVTERLPTISRLVRYEEMIADPRGALRVVAELCGLPEPSSEIPELGDDRGCAGPYHALMTGAVDA